MYPVSSVLNNQSHYPNIAVPAFFCDVSLYLYTLGEEKERLMARQKSTKPTPLAKSEDAALDRLRSDLIDSSDEEDARNPMGQASPHCEILIQFLCF